jgi:hypothetical protein
MQQRQGDGQDAEAVGQSEGQAGMQPVASRQMAGDDEVALHAERHHRGRQQHTEQNEAQQMIEFVQRRIEAAPGGHQPAQPHGQGFRQGMQRRPVPVQIPQRHAQQRIEEQRGEYPWPPPEAERQSQGEGHIPDRHPAGELGGKG